MSRAKYFFLFFLVGRNKKNIPDKRRQKNSNKQATAVVSIWRRPLQQQQQKSQTHAHTHTHSEEERK